MCTRFHEWHPDFIDAIKGGEEMNRTVANKEKRTTIVRALLDALGGAVPSGVVLSADRGSWEYTDLYAENFPNRELNEMGERGWELVAMDCSSNTGKDIYILKRPLPTPQQIAALAAMQRRRTRDER